MSKVYARAGLYIRAKRRARGLTQENLGLALGYDATAARSAICHWEAGRRGVPRDKLVKLSQILNVPVNLLIS